MSDVTPNDPLADAFEAASYAAEVRCRAEDARFEQDAVAAMEEQLRRSGSWDDTARTVTDQWSWGARSLAGPVAAVLSLYAAALVGGSAVRVFLWAAGF